MKGATCGDKCTGKYHPDGVVQLSSTECLSVLWLIVYSLCPVQNLCFYSLSTLSFTLFPLAARKGKFVCIVPFGNKEIQSVYVRHKRHRDEIQRNIKQHKKTHINGI